LKSTTVHPDTQAIFTSIASFNALTKSDTAGIPAVPFKEPLPAYSPEHTTAIGQYYFRCVVDIMIKYWKNPPSLLKFK
jgi:hypothetical protein